MSLLKHCVVVDFEADIFRRCLSPAGKLPVYSRSRRKSIAVKRDKIYFMCFVSLCVEDLLSTGPERPSPLLLSLSQN